ncbi:MAG TPA: sigma-70 family RNA polymerase sigma factor [Solirubrobacterales bacterium]|nr:sigma-70 family RNA polymerase sigma factor [Solirubrobacterales bacterium]
MRRASGGDEVAFRALLNRHRDVLAIAVNKYFAPGHEWADLHSEALLGFHKAVRDFRVGNGSGFRNFASLTVHRQVVTAVKTATRKKHGPLNFARSVNAPVGDVDSDLTLEEILPDPGCTDPAEILAGRDDLAAVVEAVGELTELERNALLGTVDGTYADVAAEFEVTEKQIDNALQRAKSKLARRVGSGADEELKPRPLGRINQPDQRRAAPLPRRSRQRRSGRRRASTPPRRRRAHSPQPRQEAPPTMTIVESVDAEILSVEEEIKQLEEARENVELEITTRKARHAGLVDIRDRAIHVDADPVSYETEGASKAPAPPPPARPKREPQQPSPERSTAIAERADRIVELVRKHPDEGLAARDIRRELHLSASQFSDLRPHLVDRVRLSGNGRARRYFPLGSADRPKQAPAEERRAAPAPVRRSHARRNTAAAEAHNALRQRVLDTLLEVLAEGPMGKDRATEKVLEQVPDATGQIVSTVRSKLLQERRVEYRANKLQLTGVDRAQPITGVEKEVVACLGSGRTVKEVAANCKLIRNAFSARSILSALEQRGVVCRRPGGEPAVYTAADRLQAVAA